MSCVDPVRCSVAQSQLPTPRTTWYGQPQGGERPHMMRRKAATVALVGLLLPWAAPAFADRLFAANGGGGSNSTLFILDPATGAVDSTVGPIGSPVWLRIRPKYRHPLRLDRKQLRAQFDSDRPHDGCGNADWSVQHQYAHGRSHVWSVGSPVRLVGLHRNTWSVHHRRSNRRGNFRRTERWARLLPRRQRAGIGRRGQPVRGATNDVADVAALFSVDPAPAVSTFIANLTPLPGNPDASVSALAFDSAGTLFGSLAELQQLSK